MEYGTVCVLSNKDRINVLVWLENIELAILSDFAGGVTNGPNEWKHKKHEGQL